MELNTASDHESCHSKKLGLDNGTVRRGLTMNLMMELCVYLTLNCVSLKVCSFYFLLVNTTFILSGWFYISELSNLLFELSIWLGSGISLFLNFSKGQPICANLPLSGYLLETVQRIPRYKLLLQGR